MIGTRHEEYSVWEEGLPFRFSPEIERTSFFASDAQNWHEDLELQFCVSGGGSAILNGVAYDFSPGEFIVVNSNVLHYTGTSNRITYACLSISATHCQTLGIDLHAHDFFPKLREPSFTSAFRSFCQVYAAEDAPFRKAKLNQYLLQILIALAENYSSEKNVPQSSDRAMEAVKAAIGYIRENFHRKITLEEIARAGLVDKFALCREFKKYTSQTVVEYTNAYRCQKAAEFLSAGYSVTETAGLCGFSNLSFFTKTFRSYTGVLPSQYVAK